MSPFGSRFSDFVTICTSIGQILGLMGITLFSINLILAGRSKFLDRYFNGLDKVYAHHRMIGSLAFSMMLFHPIFLMIKYLAISTKEAALFFVPFINVPITWGIISLLIMIILIVFTLYIKLKYHIWKISHKFMTVAFIFAIFHTFHISSDISRNNFLRYYILLFALVGIILSIRQAFLNKVLVKKLKYKIKEVKGLNKDIVSIEMSPVENKIKFQPGQFVFVSFDDKNTTRESHPFSIASSPNENNFKLVIKNFGDFTSKLSILSTNTDVLVEGPYGNFSFNNIKNKNQVWIAGGIGITPFLSMSKSLDDSYDVSLYYCVKEDNEAVLLDEFTKIQEINKNFKIKLWISSKNGFINANIISSEIGELGGKDIFMCGPSVFMNSLNEQFIVLKVEKNKIHYENFNF
jgi:predicted ferric reductase